MNQVKSYTPSLVLALVALMVLFGGPYVMRELAYAEQKGRIDEARDRLQSGPLVDLNESFRSVARVMEPSVAHISVRRQGRQVMMDRGPIDGDPFGGEVVPEPFRRFFEGPERLRPRRPQPQPREENEYERYNVPREIGNGSGWVYQHANGKKYVITNNHVVETADEIGVTFPNKSTAKAKVLGTDPQTDIAVLEVEDQDLLHPAKVAEGPVEQGEIVFAFGSPLHFEFSMSQGIVSAENRQLGILDKRDAQGQPIQQGYEDFIQTDAAINFGNSGGPLVNVYGEVVGMNSVMASLGGGSSGLGFAIPSEMIRDIVPKLIDQGRVQRGYLGVAIRDLDPEMAQTFGFEGEGVLVDDVPNKEGPAGKAGIQAEDIITEVNGKPVSTASQLRGLVANIPPGQTIELKVFRDGKPLTLKAELGEQPPEMTGRPLGDRPTIDEGTPDSDKLEELRKLGFERLTTMTEEVAARAGIDFVQGVLITGVRPGSVAEAELIMPGMVITEVQGEPVKSVEELAEAVGKADLTKGVRFRVQRGTGGRSIVLSLPD